jgi:ADP-ribose pyrophosphatase
MPTEPQLVKQESIFDGRIIKVRVDTLLLPDGQQVQREVVVHNGAVVMVPIDQDDHVLLVRQYRHAAGESLLEAPAGTLEDSEAPEDCAQRELQEEIGYASTDLRPMGGFWSSPGFCTEFLYAYAALGLVESRLSPDSDEDIAVERVPVGSIPGMIRQGEIRDAKTIAALLMATHIFK